LQFFWVTEIDPFSHVTAMFVNMPFNKEDCILNKNLYLLEGYTAQKLLKKSK